MPKKQRIYDYFYEFASEALQIVIFENFVKSMTFCSLKLKVTPSFCFAFKIPEDVTASSIYCSFWWNVHSSIYIPFLSKWQSKSFEFRWKWVLWIIDEPENLYCWQSQPSPLPVKFRWMNWEAWATKCLTRHKNCWRNQNLSVLFIYKSSSFVPRPSKMVSG